VEEIQAAEQEKRLREPLKLWYPFEKALGTICSLQASHMKGRLRNRPANQYTRLIWSYEPH
jgi:hypothetical protein